MKIQLVIHHHQKKDEEQQHLLHKIHLRKQEGRFKILNTWLKILVNFPFDSIHRVEADSSTPPVVIKVDESPQPIPEPEIDHRIIENLRISSFSNYSFEKSLNEFIDYLHNLINQYHRENILIQLFEHICTIRGLGIIILDPLKQQIRSINENEHKIYNDGLDKIENLSRTIHALIELNKMKISHIDQHSIINSSFNQFQQNLNVTILTYFFF